MPTLVPDFKPLSLRLVHVPIQDGIPTNSITDMFVDSRLYITDMEKICRVFFIIASSVVRDIDAFWGTKTWTTTDQSVTFTSDVLDVPAQLDKLRGMKPGWLDGKGTVPNHSDLDWLSDTFKQHYPNGATLPYVYPTPEGGVDMEWTIGKREISLEIDLVVRRGEWSCYDIDTGSSDEKILDLNNSSIWKWIADHHNTQ